MKGRNIVELETVEVLDVLGEQKLCVVENYRAMIAQHAWAAWRKLPLQTRAWVDIEDMIAAGVAFTINHAMKRYDPNRASSFGTFLYHALQNFYKTHYLDHHYARLRCDTMTVSISQLQETYGQGEALDVDTVLGKAGAQVSAETITACMAVDTLLAIYQRATAMLRDSIVMWFLQPTRTKFHAHGSRFRRARMEFRRISAEQGLGIDDARHLMRSTSCLDKFSREVRGVPYDLDNPTPGIRGMELAWHPELKH